jgi:type IX secretion system PorP/SprF family membrane protein
MTMQTLVMPTGAKRSENISELRVGIYFIALTLLLTLSIAPNGAMAQQRLRYTHYLQNTYLTNPGLTGIEPYMDIRAGFAQQWAGFAGAPRSIYLTAHKGFFERAPMGDKFKLNSLPAHGRAKVGPTNSIIDGRTIPGEGPNFHMGAGLQLFSESTGPISYNGLTGSFAAHVKLAGKLRMGLGTSMEMLNYRLNPASIEMLDANDITLTTNRVSLLLPTLNAGMVLYSPRFFIAASTRQLLRNRIVTNPANPVVSGLETHYFMQAGLRFNLSENISLVPSMALRTISPAPPALDMSLQGSYKDLVFLGFSYRHQDAIAFLAGCRITSLLRLDYAYDYNTSPLSTVSSGSHSIVLSICPGYVKSHGRRYFW